jgi:FtsZ-binding cell division protein ZapB
MKKQGIHLIQMAIEELKDDERLEADVKLQVLSNLRAAIKIIGNI